MFQQIGLKRARNRRRSKPRPKKKCEPSPVAKFKVGDKVRVKHGIRDTDYPDVPLDGWAGTISEVHEDGMYTVQWNKETLANVHPVVKRRSEKDGTVLEEYWLGDDDLELDLGGPFDIEQPTEIIVQPLSPKDQDDRIRMVFGLTSNDPLPEVNNQTLTAYRDYLAENLTFPFQAEYGEEYSQPERVKVIGLGDPDVQGFRPGRASLILFGHACIVTGCLLVTWGVYLLPHSEPTLSHIFGRPFFWGPISIGSGVCVIQHGFCRCISTSQRSAEADAEGCTEGHPGCRQRILGDG
jgi:uncharacterized protein YodC (DUF2158 family)